LAVVVAEVTTQHFQAIYKELVVQAVAEMVTHYQEHPHNQDNQGMLELLILAVAEAEAQVI